MQAFSGSIAALAVTAIYYVWRSYHLGQARQRRNVHERVAYMLWIVAGQSV
jgi:hypothetical protein